MTRVVPFFRWFVNTFSCELYPVFNAVYVKSLIEGLTMDFLELQSFVTICDCKNITEAARRLYITQPALSRRIRDLEEELGITLFVRRSKGIEITEAGMRLYQDAVRLLDQRRDFSIKARRLQNSQVGTVRFAAAPNIPHIPVLRAVSAMARDYPEVAQIFKTDISYDSPYMLSQNQLDVLMCGKSEVLNFPDVHYEVLHESPLSIFVGKGHRFWTWERISWEDLSGETVILHLGQTRSMKPHVELTLRKYCPTIKHILYCGSIEECMYNAAASRYVALCGTSEWECLPAIPDILRNISIEGPELDWSSPAAAYNPQNPFAIIFTEYLKKEFNTV